MRVGRFSLATLGKVAGFGVVSVALTLGLLVKIGNLRVFAHTYELEAEFRDASGVFRGDAVKLAGVDVGRVMDAHIENGKAVVRFNVDDDVRLASDTVIGVRWRNVLGQRFLYVFPGTAGGPPLEDGDRVPLSRTQTAGDIGEFLNHLVPVLKAIDPDKANAFLDAVNIALSGNEANVRELITDGATLAQQLAEMDEEIKSVIASSDTVLSTYAKQDEAIGSIIDNLDVLSARLESMTSDVNALLVNFADVQTQLDKLLRGNRTNIDQSLRNLRVVARTLEDNRHDLAATLCTLPIGFAGYFQTTRWGEWFNVRITQIVLKDSSGNYIVDPQELEQQRSGAYAGAFTGCGGERSAVGLGGSPSSGYDAKGQGKGGSGSSGASKDAESTSSGGFEDVSGLIRFVLQGA